MNHIILASSHKFLAEFFSHVFPFLFIRIDDILNQTVIFLLAIGFEFQTNLSSDILT